VKARVGQQKKRASRSLNRVADALRQTSHHLDEEDQQKLGDYAEQAAHWVEEFSGYLQEHEVDDLLREVENFGRRRPEIFVGGAFLVGFLAARFFKSTSRGGEWEDEEFPAAGSAAGAVHTQPAETWNPAPASPAMAGAGALETPAPVSTAPAQPPTPSAVSAESQAWLNAATGDAPRAAGTTGTLAEDLDDTDDTEVDTGTASRRTRG
jgi:hypothetical protein